MKERNRFEWPKAQDILAGKTDKPIKVVSFTYRTYVACIHSIQVTLSNGQASSIFEGFSKDNLSAFKLCKSGMRHL